MQKIENRGIIKLKYISWIWKEKILKRGLGIRKIVGCYPTLKNMNIKHMSNRSERLLVLFVLAVIKYKQFYFDSLGTKNEYWLFGRKSLWNKVQQRKAQQRKRQKR